MEEKTTYSDLGGGGQTRKLIKLSVVWNVFFGSSIRLERSFKLMDDDTVHIKTYMIMRLTHPKVN